MTVKTPTTPILTLERVFDATPQKLWAYWTEPLRYAKWLNPAPGHDLVIHEWDLRVGGKVRFDMPQPDGNPNPQEGVFHVLEPFTRLVTGSEDKSFLLEVTFHPVTANTTRMVVKATGVPQEWHAAATQGWNAGLDKLERELVKPSLPGFTLERTFRAPPGKVWAMWTTPEGIGRWWVPSAKDMGYDLRVLHMDVRSGGSFAFELKNARMTLVNKGTYIDVKPHRRLAWVWHYDIFLKPDEKPYDVPIAVELEPAADGGTRMTFSQGPLASAEYTEGSRKGVLQNLEWLAKALDG